MKISKKDLQLPKIIPSQIKNIHPFIRPYRKGGIRLEHQLINEKHIIHNYGQGGSEVCLAYGCAYISCKSMSVKVEPSKLIQVAVLGSGIVGLITAIELLKKGHRVVIYSENFPKFGEENPNKRLSSQMKAHVWYPAYYDNQDPLKHELLSKLSYDYFKDCIKTSRYQSISWTNFYSKGAKNAEMQEAVTEFISEQFKELYLNFGSQVLEEYLCFRTFLIDAELLIEELLTEAKLRNAIFETKKFQNVDDVIKLKEDCIFNCLGLSSKTVFDDQEMVGIRGYHIELPTYNIQINEPYIIRNVEEGSESELQIYMTNDKFMIGTSWEQGEQKKQIDKETINKILQSANLFIKHRSNKPYKL